jgi:hypothetical protein
MAHFPWPIPFAIYHFPFAIVIIRPIGNDLLFITQPDHARLAAEIIAAWRADGFPEHPRREAILYAAREHDNGWREEDAETLVDTAGMPLDFISAPVAAKHRIWPRAVSRLANDHPYEAALVAQHALTVHADYRERPGWQTFFDTIDGLRGALLTRAGAAAATTLEGDYRFVNIADRLSLIFCNGWRERFDDRQLRIQLTGTTLVVTPDPFGGVRVPMRVIARRLPGRSYGSSADLRASLDEAPIELVEGEATGG